MARISQRLVSVGLGKESTRGTAVAPTAWAPKLELSFRDKIDKIRNESHYGVLERYSGGHIVKQWGEGDLKGAIYRNFFGHLLSNFFGQAPATTTVETTAKQHVFTFAETNSGLTHTIAIDEPNEDLRFPLAMVDTFTIDYVVNNYVMFMAKFMSKKSTATANTTAFANETKFVPKHAVVKIAATGSGNLGAAAALTNIIAIKLEFKKNLHATQGLGSTDLEGLNNTTFEVNGSIERYYDDATSFRTYARNNTDKSLRVDLIDTDTIVGASTNPKLTFDFEQISVDFPDEGNQNSLITETMKFTGLWNFSASKMVTATMVNDQASY